MEPVHTRAHTDTQTDAFCSTLCNRRVSGAGAAVRTVCVADRADTAIVRAASSIEHRSLVQVCSALGDSHMLGACGHRCSPRGDPAAPVRIGYVSQPRRWDGPLRASYADTARTPARTQRARGQDSAAGKLALASCVIGLCSQGGYASCHNCEPRLCHTDADPDCKREMSAKPCYGQESAQRICGEPT